MIQGSVSVKTWVGVRFSSFQPPDVDVDVYK